MSSDESDSELRELLEEDEEPKKNIVLTPEDFILRKKYVSEIGDKVFSDLPGIPDNYTERLLYYYYYAVQFAILYHKLDGQKPVLDIVNDSDDVIREKAYYMHLDNCYREFNSMVEILANNVLGSIKNKIKARSDSENAKTLLYMLDQFVKFKELHTRRIKSDPAAPRTKVDSTASKITYNLVTGERYNHENEDHKSWRMLVVNPLPSDYDINEIDPKEGGRTHALAIEAEKLKGNYHVPEPFYVVVTTEWDKLCRLVHVLVHFEEYMHSYLIGAFDTTSIINMNWKDAWNYLFKEHADVPIKNLSREKKKTPQIVSRTAELRDFLECAVGFDETPRK